MRLPFDGNVHRLRVVQYTPFWRVHLVIVFNIPGHQKDI